MNVLHRLTQGIVLVALIVVGAGLLFAAMWPGSWETVSVAVEHGRFLAGWLGLGTLCFGLVFGLSGLRGGRRERFLSFDTEGGTVSISTQAIADYVAKLAGEFPSILRLRPEVIPRRRAIDIKAELRVKAGPQIHEVCDLLQQRIRESVTTGLGISELRRVEVSVRDIASEHRPG